MAKKVRLILPDEFDKAVGNAEVKMMLNSIITSRRKPQGSRGAFQAQCQALLHAMAANEALYGADGFSVAVRAK